jgi:translation initiation factor 1
MPNNNRRLAYSTDPVEEKKPVHPQLPANPAAAIPTRQLNTPVRVWLEKNGRGGKVVSVIKGVMSPPAGKEALARVLKQRIGVGGSVKEEDIEIQGDQRDKIVVILKELGYQAKIAGG